MSRRLPSRPTSLLFAPMIYVAWADGGLEASELDAIADELANHPDLPEDVRGEISAWLDPDNPPGAGELATLLERVRSMAADLKQPKRQTLRELGQELARRAGHEVSKSEIEALAALEDAIGITGTERASSIMWPIAAEPISRAEGAAFLGPLTAALARPNPSLRREVLDFLATLEPRGDQGRVEYRETVHAWLGKLADKGWGRLPFPEAVGGQDNLGAFLTVFETLGVGDLSLLVKYGVQFGLFGLGIAKLGSEAHHSEHLPAAGALELAGCYAMTETGHGSNVGDLETTATFDAETDEFIINTPSPEARKDYIGNAANYARLAVVFAQLKIGELDHGVHALVVPLRDEAGRILPGRLIEECGEKLGLEGVDNGRISFNQVRVPRSALLDRFAQVDSSGEYTSAIASPRRRFFTMLGTLVGGRIAVASAAVSATKLAQTIAIRYAHRRRQFGPSGSQELRLIDYPQHRRRLIPDLAKTFALHCATRDLGAQYASGSSGEKFESDVAAIKALATWHASKTIGECREACGGRGYLADARFAELKADTDVFTTFEGDNTVLLQLVAKSLLSDYAKGMRDLGVLGIARFIAKRAQSVFDRNPYIVRRTDPEHLRDRELGRELFAARTDDLLHSLAKRLKRRIDDGMDSFSALVDCQPHAIDLARARAEQLAIESLIAFEKRNAIDVLASVRALAALAWIEDDAAWFLENGYFEASKSAAIRDEIRALSAEVALVSTDLVAAFGFPDTVVRSPIGTA